MNSRPTLWVKSAEIKSGKIVLTVNGNVPIADRLSYTILFAPGILVPEGAENEMQVVFSLNGAEYTTWDMFGMVLQMGEIPTFTNAAGVYFATRKPMATGIGSNEGAYRLIVWNLPKH